MDPNNWDLQAVVRGCCFTDTTAAATVDPFFSVPNPLLPKEGEQVHGDEEVLLTSFPELSATRTALYELEELCSPFDLTTVRHPPPPPQQQQSVHLSSSSSAAANTASLAPHLPQQPRQPHRPQSQITRSKRRKSQLKKVVRQVPADGVSSDMWAWRKYGQKPIKGSPHPRGYYRCSSSKGCPARKQVERSVAEPGMLVITYTAEHNHPVPTHLNSLAGSTRHKLPPPPSSAASTLGGGGERERLLPRIDRSSSPLSTLDGAVLSPVTPLTSSVEDERLCRWWRRPCKGEERDVEEDEEDQPLTVGDMGMIGEDDMLFPGLEGVGGRTAVAATYPSAAVSVGPVFLEDGNGFAGRFFPCSDPMRCPVP